MERAKFYLLILLLPFILACTAAVVGGAGIGGAATYKYISGKLVVTYGYPYPEVWSATNRAIKSLKFTVISSTHDGIEGEIKCQSATGKKIKIKVKTISDKVTNVYIKVGFFGDMNFSLQIAREIGRFLTGKKH